MAGIGDLDILGDRKPVSYLREAVYGIGHQPAIGVLRMNKPIEKAGKTPWMWKDNIASWTWDGFEGKTASVDVYANADEVELFLNQKSFGKKNIAGVFVAEYQVPYEAGILEAVSYCNGKEVGRSLLKSAAKAVLLKAEPDRDYLPADGNSLLFIPIRLADHQETGIVCRKIEFPSILREKDTFRDSAVRIQAVWEAIRMLPGTHTMVRLWR